ncbi:2-hydroxymuconic semialdehyde dehydrogenase [Hoeflea sp. WL0058]|uniref:2-hydroxymuconic semialdehyde dehydrogenase n=1 Tax=Flavimaribacter sediminis TaxID=2865987 RepID=A0AAE2ZM04_9HYPH|nr:2-hydroxymuconic semialdehyde dehydrogenase [Flavimaribacter sediminis]MBW8638444.1 2-hydroxymuconic semialdehyde dehydrogenase [Flavimaribacter sediminis]
MHGGSPSRIRNVVGGAHVEGDRRFFEDINPATGKTVALVEEATRDDVDRAVNAARAALKGPWGKLTQDERAKALHRIADGVEARFDEFLKAEILDTGKPVSLASHLDIPRGAANFRAFAELPKHHAGEFFPMRTPDGGDALNYSLRSPRGVIAVICPWNLPLLLMTWKVGPALACGNTVVVKPSEETPATATLLAEVMRDAGIPDGVYNVVNGLGPDSAGQFLTEHPGVDGITFTGETRTGEAIMAAAAKGVRPVSFELGGKNAGIVFADCDIEKALDQSVRAVFANAGQVCLQTERLYVERPIFDQFVEGLAARAAKQKPGDPFDKGTTFGPVISDEHRTKILGYYDKAAAQGAKVVSGGGVIEMEGDLADGHWIAPTIWTGLDDDSDIVREEIFGPCVHIAPFDSEDEAIARTNATEYGLASMLWTQDLSRAHRVAAQLEAGITWVNSWFLRDLRTAFGGMKHSGIGREGGIHGLEFYTELRNVCVRI